MDNERHSNRRERDKHKLAVLSSLQKPGNLEMTLVQSREFAYPVPYYDWTLAGYSVIFQSAKGLSIEIAKQSLNPWSSTNLRIAQ